MPWQKKIKSPRGLMQSSAKILGSWYSLKNKEFRKGCWADVKEYFQTRMAIFSVKPQLWLLKVIDQVMSFKASDIILTILVKKPEWNKVNIAHREMADRSPDTTVNRLYDCNQKDQHSLRWCWRRRDYFTSMLEMCRSYDQLVYRLEIKHWKLSVLKRA